MTAASLGKMPTTRARRLISLLTRSKGLVLQISPIAAHLTQPRRSPPKPTTRRDAHLPETSTYDRTPRDAYLAGR
jgi:hypothetical protein